MIRMSIFHCILVYIATKLSGIAETVIRLYRNIIQAKAFAAIAVAGTAAMAVATVPLLEGARATRRTFARRTISRSRCFRKIER